MRKSDIWIGLVLIGAAVAALIEAWSFESVPGMKFGAWTFPVVVSGLLLVCGTVLVLSSALRQTASPLDDIDVLPTKLWSRLGVAFFAIPAMPIGYILLADRMGFLICAASILFLLSFLLWRQVLRCVLLAVITAPILELIFAKGFSVPLPKGLFSLVGLF